MCFLHSGMEPVSHDRKKRHLNSMKRKETTVFFCSHYTHPDPSPPWLLYPGSGRVVRPLETPQAPRPPPGPPPPHTHPNRPFPISKAPVSLASCCHVRMKSGGIGSFKATAMQMDLCAGLPLFTRMHVARKGFVRACAMAQSERERERGADASRCCIPSQGHTRTGRRKTQASAHCQHRGDTSYFQPEKRCLR